ncbi:MAG: arginine--tRNA ligase, partial [Paludibacteraceae bacterium]|nr:arginine--tRNA ligase [Paludibacteraceae bacterium]
MENQLKNAVVAAVEQLYGSAPDQSQITLQKTKKEFVGDWTLVTFPLLKLSRKNPAQTAQEIGDYLKENVSIVADINVINGFLNIVLKQGSWLDTLGKMDADANYGLVPVTENSPLVMIEYSSPNTNKPLHLGHIRNNLLGYSLAEIMKANGYKVIKTNIVNDRGIHICKSMLAWQKFGAGATPESVGKKGDHLVGDYYVAFDKAYKEE